MGSRELTTGALASGVRACWWKRVPRRLGAVRLGVGLAAAGLAVVTMLGGCARRATVVGGNDELPQDQWSRGVWQYGQQCAGCHGENGEGSEDGPALVGAEALPEAATGDSDREVAFRNWSDVFAYSSDKMPALDPGTVEDDAMWAILAYVAKARGAQLDGDLGAANASKIPLR